MSFKFENMVDVPWEKIQATHIPVAAETNNLGDDIQSEAGARLFNCRNYINRDNPKSWPKDSIVPFFGWWSHVDWYKSTFADYKNYVAQAFIVGFNLSPYRIKEFNDKSTIDWLQDMVKQQGFPAMCRDIFTRDFLRRLGIDAEFGGCVTLTLPTFKGEREGLYNVDINNDEYNYKALTHAISSLKELTMEERIEKGREQIEIYKKARHIVTSRLHVWLPCLAMGTSVSFVKINNIFEPQRFTGYMEMQ